MLQLCVWSSCGAVVRALPVRRRRRRRKGETYHVYHSEAKVEHDRLHCRSVLFAPLLSAVPEQLVENDGVQVSRTALGRVRGLQE